MSLGLTGEYILHDFSNGPESVSPYSQLWNMSSWKPHRQCKPQNWTRSFSPICFPLFISCQIFIPNTFLFVTSPSHPPWLKSSRSLILCLSDISDKLFFQVTVQALACPACIHPLLLIHPSHCRHRFPTQICPSRSPIKIFKWFLFRIKFLPPHFSLRSPSPLHEPCASQVPWNWCSFFPSWLHVLFCRKHPSLPCRIGQFLLSRLSSCVTFLTLLFPPFWIMCPSLL